MALNMALSTYPTHAPYMSFADNNLLVCDLASGEDDDIIIIPMKREIGID